MNIELNASSASIYAGSRGMVTVELSDVDKSDILDFFDENDAINHFDKDAILEQIGEDYCKDYFGI